MSTRNASLDLPPIEPFLASLRHDTGVLLAVSGGPDSQALLDWIGRHRGAFGRLRLAAAGVDHGLRVGAADELQLASARAAVHCIPFYVLNLTERPSGNVLAWARVARYKALRSLADSLSMSAIVTAHTATDQLETFLLSLLRGASARGLAGMRPRSGRVVRPLVAVTKQTLVAYGMQRGLAWAEDPSNSNQDRARARLRKQVLPHLQSLSPRVEHHAVRVAMSLGEDETYLTEQADILLLKLESPEGALDGPQVLRLANPLRRRVVRSWLEARGSMLGYKACARLDGALKAHLVTGHSALVGVFCGRIVLCEKKLLWWPHEELAERPDPLTIDAQAMRYLRWGKTFFHLNCRPIGAEEAALWPAQAADSVAFDADRLHLQLLIRPWQRGDTVRLWGLGGRKKVGDLFTDVKVPRPKRSNWPLVMHGDEVAWVVGIRRGALAPVLPTTRRLLVMRASSEACARVDPATS